MFSERFMKESGNCVPSHPQYRHCLQRAAGSRMKRETAVFSSNSELSTAEHMVSYPTKMNVYPHQVSMDPKHWRSGLGVSSGALYNSKFHVINQSTHPTLLQKRCNSRASLISNNVSKVNHLLDHTVHVQSPAYNTPMRDLTKTSRSYRNFFTSGLEGQCVSYRTVEATQSTDSVLQPPAITYERSWSICGAASNVHSKHNQDLRRKLSTCSVLKLQPKNKVTIMRTKFAAICE